VAAAAPEGASGLDDVVYPLLRLAHEHADGERHAALAGGAERSAGHGVDDGGTGGIGEDDAVVLGSHVALNAFAGGAGAAVDVLACASQGVTRGWGRRQKWRRETW
jgi:hypothetical protein